MNTFCSDVNKVKNILKNAVTYSEAIPDKSEFFELFETTGWNKNYKLSSDDLYNALERSWYIVSAYNDQQLVGFGRIICDGTVHALILDLIVHPKFQQNGIGGRVLDKLVTICQQHKIRDIQLFSAKEKASFYEKRGFILRKNDAPGMEFKLQ